MHLVLVVEDEYGSAEALTLLLAGEGYVVEVAVNGRDGLLKVAERRPDIILTDFMMPLMNGAQMCADLRANTGLAAIPIVMTSSAEESLVREQFSDYDAFLRKPFAATRLLPLIARLVSEGRPAAQIADGLAGVTAEENAIAAESVQDLLRRVTPSFDAPASGDAPTDGDAKPNT